MKNNFNIDLNIHNLINKFSFILILIILTTFSNQSKIFAFKNQSKNKLESGIKNTQNIKNDLKNKMKNEEKQKQEEVYKKNKIESEINFLNYEVKVVNNCIKENAKNLSVKEKELQEAENEKKVEREKFKERLRIMYENRNFTYLEPIFSSKDLADFVRKTDLIFEVVKSNEKLIEEIEKTEKKIVKAKAEIQNIRMAQEAMSQRSGNKIKELEFKKKERIECIEEIKKNIEEYKRKYDEAERAEESLKRELRKILAKASQLPTIIATKGFRWPSDCGSVSSPFGYRIHPIFKIRKFHTGIDIPACHGTNIYSSKNGNVIFVGGNGGYGNCIVINHENGISTLYAHLSSFCVSIGQNVSMGQVIGKTGATGNATGAHLHYEILVNGSSVDPLQYFR